MRHHPVRKKLYTLMLSSKKHISIVRKNSARKATPSPNLRRSEVTL